MSMVDQPQHAIELLATQGTDVRRRAIGGDVEVDELPGDGVDPHFVVVARRERLAFLCLRDDGDVRVRAQVAGAEGHVVRGDGADGGRVDG